MKLATRHECMVKATVRCDRGAGKPKRKRCSACGGRYSVYRGLYGVFAWRGDGGYREEEAVAARFLESSAERFAKALGDKYVVRWISKEADLQQ